MFVRRDREKLDEISDRLFRIEWLVRKIFLKGYVEMATLDAIKDQVRRNGEVDGSVKALVMGLKAKLDELASRDTVDPAEVQAIADELGAQNDDLAAAVTANTPAESAPAPTDGS